jgi:NADH:ubiquinone oxidoreductase subunit H
MINITLLPLVFLIIVSQIVYLIQVYNIGITNNLYLLMLLSLTSLALIHLSITYSTISLVGIFRMLINIVSYEVLLIILFFIFTFINSTYYLILINYSNNIVLYVIMLIVLVQEIGRAPFDMVTDAEAEIIISSFTIELSTNLILASIIFSSEYILGLIFMSLLISTINLYYINLITIFVFLFICIRGFYSRIKLEQLFIFNWFYILPILFTILYLVL